MILKSLGLKTVSKLRKSKIVQYLKRVYWKTTAAQIYFFTRYMICTCTGHFSRCYCNVNTKKNITLRLLHMSSSNIQTSKQFLSQMDHHCQFMIDFLRFFVDDSKKTSVQFVSLLKTFFLKNSNFEQTGTGTSLIGLFLTQLVFHHCLCSCTSSFSVFNGFVDVKAGGWIMFESIPLMNASVTYV